MRARSGSVSSGRATSKAVPTFRPKKLGGVTLMIEGDPLDVRCGRRVGVGAEPPLPEAVADHRDRTVGTIATQVIGRAESGR
jgi:hypothetical protein